MLIKSAKSFMIQAALTPKILVFVLSLTALFFFNPIMIETAPGDIDDDGVADESDNNPNEQVLGDDTEYLFPDVFSRSANVFANDDYFAANGTTITFVDTGLGTYLSSPAPINFAGGITIRPDGYNIGENYSIVYEVCHTVPDPSVCSTATLTVFLVNFHEANPDTIETFVDTTVEVSPLANDDLRFTSESEFIDVFDSTTTQGGVVTLDSNTNQFIYTPPNGFLGTDTFNYTLCSVYESEGPQQYCESATVTATVILPAPDIDAGISDDIDNVIEEADNADGPILIRTGGIF